MLEWRKTIQLVHKEEMAQGIPEGSTEAAQQENQRRTAKGAEHVELKKAHDAMLKDIQDRKSKEKNNRPVFKLGKKLMTCETKKELNKKSPVKVRPNFEKAFQAYLGLNLEEQPELAGTETYKEGLVNEEWNDGTNYN